MEAFGIASAVVSIVLGAFAIWLSIVFYRMSVESSNRIQESAKDLSSSVSRLEKLFEHLYSDTFSMMRDTYSDIRKHMWPETTDQEPEIIEQIETRADSKIDHIRKELMGQIETIATQVGGTDAKVNQLRNELSPVVDEAISRSRHVEAEAQEETLRDYLIGRIRSAGSGGIEASNLLDDIFGKNRAWSQDFMSELNKLRDEGIVIFVDTGPNERLTANTRIIYYTIEAKDRKDKGPRKP